MYEKEREKREEDRQKGEVLKESKGNEEDKTANVVESSEIKGKKKQKKDKK